MFDKGTLRTQTISFAFPDIVMRCRFPDKGVPTIDRARRCSSMQVLNRKECGLRNVGLPIRSCDAVLYVEYTQLS